MKGAYKKFDKKLYEANDKIAKRITKQVLEKDFEKIGITIFENPDQYGVDLYLTKNEKIIGMQSVRSSWCGNLLYFHTIVFSFQKERPNLLF